MILQLLPAKIKAIERKMRAVGILRTLALIVVHFKNLIIHRKHLIYFANISADKSNQYSRKESLGAREITNVDDLTQDDLRAITNYSGERYVKNIQKRLENNWILYLGYINKELGGAAWVVPDFSEAAAPSGSNPMDSGVSRTTSSARTTIMILTLRP